jgi:hypothetical protein
MQTRTRALSLYKSILRAHDRYLPSQSMKQLGDAYVKSEVSAGVKKCDGVARMGYHLPRCSVDHHEVFHSSGVGVIAMMFQDEVSIRREDQSRERTCAGRWSADGREVFVPSHRHRSSLEALISPAWHSTTLSLSESSRRNYHPSPDFVCSARRMRVTFNSHHPKTVSAAQECQIGASVHVLSRMGEIPRAHRTDRTGESVNRRRYGRPSAAAGTPVALESNANRGTGASTATEEAAGGVAILREGCIERRCIQRGSGRPAG